MRHNTYAIVNIKDKWEAECLQYNARSPEDALDRIIDYYGMVRYVANGGGSNLFKLCRLIDDNRVDMGIIVYAVIYKGDLIYTNARYTDEIEC